MLDQDVSSRGTLRARFGAIEGATLYAKRLPPKAVEASALSMSEWLDCAVRPTRALDGGGDDVGRQGNERR